MEQSILDGFKKAVAAAVCAVGITSACETSPNALKTPDVAITDNTPAGRRAYHQETLAQFDTLVSQVNRVSDMLYGPILVDVKGLNKEERAARETAQFMHPDRTPRDKLIVDTSNPAGSIKVIETALKTMEGSHGMARFLSALSDEARMDFADKTWKNLEQGHLNVAARVQVEAGFPAPQQGFKP